MNNLPPIVSADFLMLESQILKSIDRESSHDIADETRGLIESYLVDAAAACRHPSEVALYAERLQTCSNGKVSQCDAEGEISARMSELNPYIKKKAVTGVTTSLPRNGGASSGDAAKDTSVTAVTSWPKSNERPCYRVYDEQVQDNDGTGRRPGVWHHIIDTSGGEVTEVDEWISTPLNVEAIAANSRETNFGRLLRVKNRYGSHKQWCMPMSLLKGSGEDFRGELLSLGLEYDPKKRGRLVDFVFSQDPSRRVISVTQTGWAGNGIFALPDSVFGDGDIVFQNEQPGIGDYSQAGEIESWKNLIGNRSKDNPILMLAICTALAGPLLKPTHKGNGGFHIVGDSSCGKSTALQVASSVWGDPEQFMKTWRATSNGLEGVFALRNDTFVALDEIGEAVPREVGAIVYAMGNGTGKQRAGRSGNARPLKKYRLLLLSSGERKLEAIISECGQRVTAGQQVRLLDISADRKYGAFDNLHDLDNGREFSDTLKTVTGKHYGHLGPAFLECLVSDNLPDLGAALETVKSEFGAAEGQLGRGADRFALAAFAGELATSYGLLPWDKGGATKACIQLYESWISERGHGKTEDRQILGLVSDFIDKHGDSRFTDINSRDESDNKLSGGARAGYWESTENGRAYIFNAPGLKEATQGFDFERAKRALVAAGWMAATVAKSRHTPHGKPKLYAPIKQWEIE